MTERAYRDKLTAASQSLGVYRAEFTRTRSRLAKLYVMMEAIWREYTAAEDPATRAALEDRYGKLSDRALSCEKALGLTAESLRKIREDAFQVQQEDVLTKTLRMIRSG